MSTNSDNNSSVFLKRDIKRITTGIITDKQSILTAVKAPMTINPIAKGGLKGLLQENKTLKEKLATTTAGYNALMKRHSDLTMQFMVLIPRVYTLAGLVAALWSEDIITEIHTKHVLIARANPLSRHLVDGATRLNSFLDEFNSTVASFCVDQTEDLAVPELTVDEMADFLRDMHVEESILTVDKLVTKE
jgi:hypothetical protein